MGGERRWGGRGSAIAVGAARRLTNARRSRANIHPLGQDSQDAPIGSAEGWSSRLRATPTGLVFRSVSARNEEIEFALSESERPGISAPESPGGSEQADACRSAVIFYGG